MSKLDLSPSFEVGRLDAGERMELLTAAMAGRLARLLDRALPAEEAVASRDFLRAMEAAADGPAVHWKVEAEDYPLTRLENAFALSPLEVDLIVLAGLPDEHEGYSGILRTLHPTGDPRPTAGLAAQLFCVDSADRRDLRTVLEIGPAARNGIVRLVGDGPLFERSLLLADALWSVLHGLDTWPATVRPIDEPLADAGLREWLAGPEAAPAIAAIGRAEPITILVTAESEETAVQRAAILAATAGAEPVRLRFATEPDADSQRLLAVHAIARGVVPIVRAPASTGPGASVAPSFAGYPGPVVIGSRHGGMVASAARTVIHVGAERLNATARADLWRAAVPELPGQAENLAARYTIEPSVAIAAVGDARAIARLEDRPLCIDDVAQGVRTRSGLAISSGVRLIRPTARWDQLVLPERRMSQLRESLERLTQQARVLDTWGFLSGRRGARGVRMLFAGASGTGKTFSAEVLAGALGVDLLMVDIFRVVSKWIGETEKNLAEVFDVAERAQAVLLFDEADALFGKRTEVSDAHDRYANLETAFLLSRLERFEGLAILSTNLRQNIDSAFLRRLEFVLDFEEPAMAERTALWRAHLPADAPVADDVDLRELGAMYAVVGGFIRNAAVASGFYAASDGSPITRAHIVRAIRREYEKSGRAFPGYPAGMAAL